MDWRAALLLINLVGTSLKTPAALRAALCHAPSGLSVLCRITQGVALGWYVMPLRGFAFLVAAGRNDD